MSFGCPEYGKHPVSQWCTDYVFGQRGHYCFKRIGMLHLSTSYRYFYYNGIADMRKGAYSLSGLVRNEMNQDVLSGDVFIFIGRRGNKIKLLQWDNDGFALYEKGLEQGCFERPATDDNGHFSINAQQLQYILQGVVLKSIRYKKRYSHTG